MRIQHNFLDDLLIPNNILLVIVQFQHLEETLYGNSPITVQK